MEAYLENNCRPDDPLSPDLKNCYTLTVLYHPKKNTIRVRHDTGNQHLTQGILKFVLSSMRKKKALDYQADDLDR